MNTIYNPKFFLTCLLLLLMFTAGKAQQTAAYTQYMDNLTPINPVYSLFQKEGSINTLVRKQWVGVPGAPTSYLLDGSLPIASINGSAGLIASNDEVAIEHLTEVNAFFAKAIRLSQVNSLGVSINAGFRNYVAKYSELDASDPVFSNDIRQSQPNIGFGVMFYSDQYYVGVSVPEINIRDLGNASQQDNVDLRNHYYFTAGINTQVSDDYNVKYSGLVSYTNGTPVLADLSAIVYLKKIIGFGFNYKTNNEVAGILSVNYEQFHIGYSYEFATSQNYVGGITNATNEVSLGFSFGKTTSNK
jgi:type IX secretion system PorP/SprF family membrane protein